MTAPAAAAAVEGYPVSRLVRGMPGWPAGLDHLARPPAAIWVAGSDRPSSPAVAVVGARRATATGLAIAAWLGRELALRDVPVVSGLALGIDGAAHRGALDGGGVTVAVLGCGLDVCYPRRHAELRRRILGQGCLVTEEEWGTPAEAWHFPKRNRLIAALVEAVVVVEAAERSGALTTARHAADLGREVLAVPGSIRNPVATGTNRLLRDGAVPLLDLDDLLEAVPALARRPAATSPRRPAAVGSPAPSPPEAEVLRLLAGGPVHPDDLGDKLGISAAELAAVLTRLELAGLVQPAPGGRVEAPAERP